MDRERRQLLLTRFERTMEMPLVILAVLMVPLLLLPFSVDLSPGWDQTFLALDWFIWAVFAVDLITRTALSENRAAYLRQHWLDVLIVVVPFLRPLRILRMTRVMGAMRIARAGILTARAAQGARRIFHVPQLLLGFTGLTVVIAGLVYLVERDAGGTIDSIPNALWWAAVTIATVGYGDTYPVTAAGRGLAVVLMVGGVGLFTALSATLAAFLLSNGKTDKEKEAPDLSGLEERLERLERLLQERLPAATEERDQVQRP